MDHLKSMCTPVKKSNQISQTWNCTLLVVWFCVIVGCRTQATAFLRHHRRCFYGSTNTPLLPAKESSQRCNLGLQKTRGWQRFLDSSFSITGQTVGGYPFSIFHAHKIPQIALIGRPNVGKSTFFNRITQQFRKGAIVDDQPGITRDRLYYSIEWKGIPFQVVDTGGLILKSSDDETGNMFYSQEIREQTLLAMNTASCILFIVDGKTGIHPYDEAIAENLRRYTKPYILCVNKCESYVHGNRQAQVFWELGLGFPHPCSAIQGEGIEKILDTCSSFLIHETISREETSTEEVIKIAFIGRPNVGKSSLMNCILGENRSIVSEMAGTTRDTLDTTIQRSMY
ncbi:putative GTP-binding protein engA [Cardiosporidium cionae]|uniref:GTP-binding protein engA n=1 Tax=Cardiosporidium cionae TaxID=476202 RepID=A0ABQ7J435_9APIC|nr:putative GTP-binding protein engA [Cardiosporidium cionae]|eukprot:KAF8817872.1 putative GTP-binding protein engA [Cardiosporidium cionae]